MQQDIATFLSWLFQQIIFYGAIAVAVTLFVVLLIILRFGGITTAAAYIEKGGTFKIFRAKEDEKSVWFGDKSFSKVVLTDESRDTEDKEYQTAAEPITYYKRFRVYRLFRCQEGVPVVLPWIAGVPIAEVTADDLNALSRGALAKGLAKSLIKRLKRDWFVLLIVFLLGVFFHAWLGTVPLPGG